MHGTRNNILVTPCYAPDYNRCAQLVYSVNKYVNGISQHLLIVDKKTFIYLRILLKVERK
jgi:hypothetical protein